jgi:hypothetical protein
MAYNLLSGSVVAPDHFGGEGFVVSGATIVGDGSSIVNVPRVSNATNNSIITNVGGDANNLTAETNLTFDGSLLNVTGHVTASSTISASYYFGDGSGLTGVSAAGGTIGDSEDGAYTDGLFTDFTTSTPIGSAIDRFNEILKIISPTPAPAVQSINYESPAGVTAKLSFGSSSAVAGYNSSSTNAGFSLVDRTGSYAAAISGSNFRLGVYDGSQDITGTINYTINLQMSGSNLNYASGAFGNGEQGTLKLELNGSSYHTASLSSLTGSGNPATGSGHSFTNDSGFMNVSVTASGFDGNGAEWYNFKHRTAKYKIDADDMNIGWNYLRVIHTVGGTDYATNYIEWINDPSGATNDLSVLNSRIENIALVGSKYLSGVEYNTDATAKYKVDINNLYRNVYAASGNPISFTVTNSSTPSSQAVSDLTSSDDNTKVLGVTGSLDVNANVDNLLSGAITANVSVTHPLKNTISNTGSVTTGNGFLIDNRTLSSTNLLERFHDEAYRKTSGSYSTQGSVVTAASVWNSQNHMTSSGATGHEDGLLYYNQKLYSPVDGDIPVGGNFAALSNVESGQPNYSSVSGTRTFFRVLSNSSGVTKSDFKITTTKNSTTFNNSGLGTGNVHLYAKIPGSTGWMDISQNFTYGSTSDGDGALIAGASNDTDSGNNVHYVTFGTQSVANNELIVLKLEADESWAGYVGQFQFQLGATTNTTTEAPALDDIDANNTGTDAILSFGSSNGVASYSNATGSSISLTNYNSNGAYTRSGDRLGAFSSKPTIAGELNEDVSSNSSNYTANAFKDAYTGSLVLQVNGIEVHSINLQSTLNSILANRNSNGSGFTVSEVYYSTTSDDIPSYNKPYRTGSYQIAAPDQNLGWNYAKVIHRIGGSDTATNYIEWVTDTDSNALAETGTALANFSHLDLYYQSGIGYFASRPSASYTYLASNVYRNVYQSGSAVSFPTTTNCSISNIRIVGDGVSTFDSGVSSTALPNLDNGADCEQEAIQVTGTVRFDSLTSISGGLGLFTDYDVAVASTVLHPLKSNLSTTSKSKTSFMVYSGSIGSTTLTAEEYFNTETYRIVSGNYASQSNATSSGNSWNSQRSVNDGASYATYNDGMITANGYALSPFNIGNAGDTRNAADGGSLQSPPNNPNYSSLSSSVRTYYRYFKNTSGLSKATFTATLYGDAFLVAKSGAFNTGSLGANDNINVELKIPYDPSYTGDDDTSTAWGDCIKPYSAGVQPITDGVGIYNGGGSDLTQTVAGGGRAIAIQLLEKQVRNNQYFVLKISAHKDWTGYLSRISITY